VGKERERDDKAAKTKRMLPRRDLTGRLLRRRFPLPPSAPPSIFAMCVRRECRGARSRDNSCCLSLLPEEREREREGESRSREGERERGRESIERGREKERRRNSDCLH